MMDFDENVESNKIEESLKKMDLIKDLDFPIEINILEIITKAEEIKEDKRKVKFELLGFISMCIVILLTVFAAAISTNPKIILYIEIIIYVFMPFVLIPITKYIKVKEGP